MRATDRTAEVRVLNTVCRNPNYDKREKYSENRIEKLMPGARVIVRRWKEDYLGDGRQVEQTRVELIEGKASNTAFSRRAFIDEIIAESTKDTVQSWDEQSQVMDVSGDHTNQAVLSLLWQDPATRGAVEAALTTFVERED